MHTDGNSASLHSRVPNHGKRWKNIMRAYLGDYEGMEAELKEMKYLTIHSEIVCFLIIHYMTFL